MQLVLDALPDANQEIQSLDIIISLSTNGLLGEDDKYADKYAGS